MFTINQACDAAANNAESVKRRRNTGIPPVTHPSQPGTCEHEVRRLIQHWIEVGNASGKINCTLGMDVPFDLVNWEDIAQCLAQLVLYIASAPTR